MKTYYLYAAYPIIFSIIVVSIFGHPNGADWSTYTGYSPKGFTYYREFISWSLINFFLKDLSVSASVWFIACYSLNSLMTIKAFQSLGGKNYYLLYPLIFSNFYLQFATNSLRQGLAYTFILIGIAYRKHIWSSFLAVFSHNSAVVILGFFEQKRRLLYFVFTAPSVLFFAIYSSGYFDGKYSVTPGNNKAFFAIALAVLIAYLTSQGKYLISALSFLTFLFYDNDNVFVRFIYYVIPLTYLYAAAEIRVSQRLKYLTFIFSVFLSPLFYLHPSISRIWGY